MCCCDTYLPTQPVVRIGQYLNIDKVSCNESADDRKDIAVFLSILFGATAAIMLAFMMFDAIINRFFRRSSIQTMEDQELERQLRSLELDEEIEEEDEFLPKNTTAHLGKPPSKMRKKPKKTIVASTRLGLKRWLEASKATSADAILCQQRLEYRLSREKYEPCPGFEAAAAAAAAAATTGSVGWPRAPSEARARPT
jgi:hypothetical protein